MRVVRAENEDAQGSSDRDAVAVVPFDPCLVGTAGDIAPPWFMAEIPVHGLLKSVFEADTAAASEFGG